MQPQPHVTRLTATIEATQPVHWPHFAGSALRGAFGRALRRAACITGQRECTGCPLRNTCAYGVVFDPAAPAQPLHPSFQDGLPRYLIEPPALGASELRPGHSQRFALVLLPGTGSHLALLQHGLRAAVEQELMRPGLFRLTDLQVSQTTLQATEPPALKVPPHTPSHITLQWRTPLRLQHLGKPLFKPAALDATTLVRALLRRQLQWQQLTQPAHPSPAEPPAAPAAPNANSEGPAALQAAALCTLDTQHLQWHDLERHSGTQGRKLPLGGLLGSATLHGPTHALHHLLPLLYLGEQLHMGKETVMGLGRYRLSLGQ